MPTFDIGLENVSLSFATKTIFTNVTQGVNEGDRIGIVGRNGDGKTTLLRMLAGEQDPDEGRVTRRRGLTMGILEQRDRLDDDATVRQAALEGRADYEWAADAASRDIVETLLAGVSLDAKVATLSGGQRRRADLARLLLHDWDILALDEPTNHLDMITIHWLAGHLKRRWPAGAGALLVVTHDRWFLDEVCESMWEVHDGLIEPFEGGYSAYILQRVERDRQADVMEAKRRNLARKELAWLSRGARARSTKQKFHVKQARALIADVPPVRNTLELKQMATSRLGKDVVDLVDVTKIWPLPDGADGNAPNVVSIQVDGEPPARPVDEEGNPIGPDTAAATTRTITGRRVLDDVTWLIGPGDRFGIVGANGVGKSTLLGIIDGTVKPTLGRVKIGKTVKFAVLSQSLDELEKLGKYQIREVLSRYKPMYVVDGKETTPAQMMERLGFSSAQLMTPIADLSGGQKRRMQFLLILLDEPNVLIMDEPGNDLDTDMLAVMEDVLDTWPGTLIVVSHDRYLLERVTDEQFALLDGKVRHLPGGVEDYIEEMDRRKAAGINGDAPLSARSSSGAVKMEGVSNSEAGSAPAGAEAALSPEEAKALRQKKYQASKRISAIERKLAKLDERIADIDAQMAAHDPSDYAGLADLSQQRDSVTSEKDGLESEWLELSELVEG